MVRSGSALGTRALEAVGQTPKPIVFDGKAGDGWFEKAYHQKEIGTAVRCDVPDAWSDTEFGEYLARLRSVLSPTIGLSSRTAEWQVPAEHGGLRRAL
jgi:hypothetical protein